MFRIGLAILCLLSFAGTASAQLFCPFGICPSPRTYNYQFNYGGYRSPPGYHRHRTFDGSIIEHGNWNNNNAYAHQNVPQPWWKYYGPQAPTRQFYYGYR